MCDYSLHHVASRPAKVGDKLITTEFNYATTGLAAVGEPGPVAVCLRPGTEVAFEGPITAKRVLSGIFGPMNYHHTVGRFRQIDLHNPATHHDALELPDGAIVKLAELMGGQRCTVLQLGLDEPVQEKTGAAIEAPWIPEPELVV